VSATTAESMRAPVNVLTVDVEEHFQVSAFEAVVPREQWDRWPSRVERNTETLLDLFDATHSKGTFFVLGWIAERHPTLVRRIAERGHEVACHGYSHRLVYTQQPEAFREETRRSKGLLEDAAGCPVLGYRSASFSIGWSNLWALDVLAECGIAYDSSLFPVRHDRYGIPGAPRHPYRVKTAAGASLVEIPPSTIRLGRATLPFGGGGYLRLFPLAVTRMAIERLNRKEGCPAVLYVHPWEVDPEQPRVTEAPLRSRFRHYVGLRTTLPKLQALLAQLPFGPMNVWLERAETLPERLLG
jgi:polysaccharide deacetylase family protein (PEP-CTERM system associated)